MSCILRGVFDAPRASLVVGRCVDGSGTYGNSGLGPVSSWPRMWRTIRGTGRGSGGFVCNTDGFDIGDGELKRHSICGKGVKPWEVVEPEAVCLPTFKWGSKPPGLSVQLLRR